MNILATDSALNGCFKATKWLYLEKRSTTTKMQLNPWEIGKPSTKSKDITCHAAEGVANGCNSLGYLTRSGLACWHVGQLWTKAVISFFMSGQVKSDWMRLMVVGASECPPTGELCSAWIKFCCKAGLLPTHIRCLNLSSPLSMVKLGTALGLVVNLASKAVAWESCWYPEMISSNHCGVIIKMAQQVSSGCALRNR